MGEADGERLARLEVKVDTLVEAMKDHVDDHKESIRNAREAKETANEAALMTAINHRSNKTQMRAAYIGGAIVVLVQIADFAMKLHGQ
jgi:hypothetical protein